MGELFNRAKDKILESKASFLNRGSGWRFVSVEKLDIPFARYVPFRGASYIPLPEKLASKKTIVNMQNRDVECFKWCITRSLNPVDRDSERITTTLREQAHQLDWTGIGQNGTHKMVATFIDSNSAELNFYSVITCHK